MNLYERSGKAIVLELWVAGAFPDVGLASGRLAQPPLREVYEVSVQVEMTDASEGRIRGI